MIEAPEAGVYFEAAVGQWCKWKLEHASLRKPQFVIYACTWTKIIWQDAMMQKEEDEQNSECSVPRELHNVWCTPIWYDGQDALRFEWAEDQQNELEEKDRFVLSRKGVEVDGDFKCVLSVDYKGWRELIAVAADRVPNDIDEGLWRLTAQPRVESEAHRMCANVRRLVEYPHV